MSSMSYKLCLFCRPILVPVQRRVHWLAVHSLCRRHVQDKHGLRSMHSLCCRQVFCVDWADEREYLHSLCCRQVFCVDWADERDYLHGVPAKLQLTSRQ